MSTPSTPAPTVSRSALDDVPRRSSSSDPTAARQNTRPDDAAQLGPFVAWMATQSLGETDRRRHREEIEDFLRWRHGDPGPPSGSRRRYEDHLAQREPDRLPDARAGLDRFAEYRIVRSRTLPVE